MRTACLQQGNVLVGAVVRVAGYVARRAAGDLAWDFAECVPNGWTSAILAHRAFNLVAVLESSVASDEDLCFR